jgi:hypothetical protein
MSEWTDRVAAIRARAEAATRGPWWTEGVPAVYAKIPKGRPNGEGIIDCVYYGRKVPEAQANAEFIAHAREDIPWLLEQLARTGSG